MSVLGIETSTAVCAAGLHIEGNRPVDRSLIESHIHSEKLLTLVQEVVSEAGIPLKDVDAVAVSIGPGSFTGLRIGLSTAKGLCFALGKPLVAVPTFEAIAESVREGEPNASRIVVMIDAKKEEFYVGEFRAGSDEAHLEGSVRVMPLEQALTVVGNGAGTIIVTDSTDRVNRRVRQQVRIERVHPYCRASVVARLGQGKLRRGEAADIVSVEPTYLKDFVVRAPSTS
jgi:tRNA threonylcarbamoyladenosine biosynthesis protein TsaB